jgi:hypothetical protein
MSDRNAVVALASGHNLDFNLQFGKGEAGDTDERACREVGPEDFLNLGPIHPEEVVDIGGVDVYLDNVG